MEISQRRISLSFVSLLLSIMGLALLISGCQENNNAVKTDTSQTLTKVDPEYVCMVNNTLFPSEQIPVQVEGKTYYGCCEMCKGTLANDPGSRTAKDPLTKEEVDKAESVAAADVKGNIYYFQNEENLTKFNNTLTN